MKEYYFENIISKYPELIENGLVFQGRQVNVCGKFVDLLFDDKHGQKLILELKKGTIIRNHISQLLDYEGYFLSHDDPTVRVMLVGNHVPNNLRRALDHHGIEWKEITISYLKSFLEEKNDKEFLKHVSEEDQENLSISEQQNYKKESINRETINKFKNDYGALSVANQTMNKLDMRNLFIEMMKKKVEEDKINSRTTSYSITNKSILNLLTKNIPLSFDNINNEAIRIDKHYNTKRTDPHIFVTDSKSCLNGTLNKQGYRLRRRNNRIVMIRINGDEELEL